MARNSKQTSRKVAKKASSILRSGKRYSAKARSTAGSALAQAPRRKKSSK